ncbi:PKD domain-containing protein [Spirosoma validum]|uniref:PKD domain-containing protein n=1 Tax=Spirosoma validum TaxID=2771355 RepID=UPI001CC2CA19|nr:right-handed parallel beta-helix repeat-containing protein [Spirosoma validum]
MVANAGADQTVQVGQLVTLDGTASRDPQGLPLTYQWTIIRKPATSVNATLAGPTTAKPTFMPDEVGEYELTMTASNGKDTRSDNVLVTASAAQPMTINADITVQTILDDRIANPNLPDYIVTKSIAVKHELTIRPGVVIAFERDVRFDINANGGILIAKGTADKKIRFVGVNPTKGYWAGIMVYSGSNANVLEQVEVLQAGSRTLLDNKKAGITLFKESQIVLKNSLIAQNDGYGLFANEEAILREFTANTFSANTEAGILLVTDNVAKLDAASVFTNGNGRNVIEINGDYIGENGQSAEIIWGGFTDKTPYRLLNDVAVRSGWKLNPGVTVEAGRDISIHINESGYLTAKGTDTQKVRFTGAGTTAAYWKGILCLSASAKNTIENAEILNAGSSSLAAGNRANLLLYGDSVLMSVRKTRIGGSGGYGIYVASGANLNDDATNSNTFDGNAQANVEHEN